MLNAPPNRLLLDRLATPLGPLLAVTDEFGLLRALWFADGEAEPLLRHSLRRQYGAVPAESGPAPASIIQALERYFAGEIAVLSEIPRAAAGTPFQQSVWAALTRIPAGATVSYGALAAKIGTPRAVRAVGTANGANPIAIVVPCHRVIGANRALTGYGGGLDRKRWLLAHEGVLLPEPLLTG
ncbi:MAG: methylated-DNA--[protein]-cysteine S-methyltransferase [Chloroflexota bacterium]|nr:methylated-DNA--[protein]-cysteine S-methyltransferase [Chloroflexota bacterium]